MGLPTVTKENGRQLTLAATGHRRFHALLGPTCRSTSFRSIARMPAQPCPAGHALGMSPGTSCVRKGSFVVPEAPRYRGLGQPRPIGNIADSETLFPQGLQGVVIVTGLNGGQLPAIPGETRFERLGFRSMEAAALGKPHFQPTALVGGVVRRPTQGDDRVEHVLLL